MQPKAVAFPTDAKLLNRARERLVKLAQRTRVELRQSYVRVGKLALVKTLAPTSMPTSSGGPTRHWRLKTYLGRVIRDIVPKTRR